MNYDLNNTFCVNFPAQIGQVVQLKRTYNERYNTYETTQEAAGIP